MTALRFNEDERLTVSRAARFSEELVSNYFKMSSIQWRRNRYDIKTAADLFPHEVVDGPYAQVIKYEARLKTRSLNSSFYNYYAICLQDPAILSKVNANEDLHLYPFLLYVITHELVHVVRFGKFFQIYEASDQRKDAMEDEEKVVHSTTYDILSQVRVNGLDTVLQYYSQWRMPE